MIPVRILVRGRSSIYICREGKTGRLIPKPAGPNVILKYIHYHLDINTSKMAMLMNKA